MIYLKISSADLQTLAKRLLLLLLFSSGLTACDQSSSHQDIVSAEQQETATSAHSSLSEEDDQGSKLADVAGQATLPVGSSQTKQASTQLSAEALKYVGRYHVHVPCSEPVSLCKKPEGQIDYVMSLLEDGHAYRQRISIGRIAVDDRQNTKTYQPDSWILDAQNNEIVVSLFGGGKLYFDIIDSKHIKANLEKINNLDHGENRKQLGEGFVLPQKSRILSKLSEEIYEPK